jgi:hypothetical protein
MFLTEMFEDAGKRLVVIYPGRFQPFHKGHADVFASLQARYGSENVFIVTSNKTDGAKSPFNFSDKVRFMHAAGIPDHSIIETNGKVYDLPDVFKPQADRIIFIAAVGAPDAQRLNPGSLKKDGTPGYFLKLPGSMDQAVSADQHGYVVIAEERAENVTIGGKSYDASHGTQCRELWNQVRDNPKQRAEFLQQLYGKNDPALGHVLDKIPTGAPEPKPKPSPKLKKVKDPKPVSEEAAGVGVVKGGSDPRYVMATMGDQNDVTPSTLNNMMRGYSLIGKKSMSNQKPVKSSIGQGIKESEVQHKFQMVREELNYIRNYTGQRDQAYYERARKIQEQIVELEEGWKSKLGAAALAGAAALGGAGPAHADGWDDVMRPINQIRKLDRDVHNRVGDVGREVWSQRSRMGRDIENIPIPGISKIGKEIRGSTNQEELHVDPAWQERVRQAEEQRRQRQERQQNRQWGQQSQQAGPDDNN